MKILLVKPKARIPTYFPPLGLAYLASTLGKEGHEVRLIDITAEGMSSEEFHTYVSKNKPDVIGISCIITEFEDTIKTASMCKSELPNVPVIVGGALPSEIPATFLKNPNIDVVVIGEGEVTILEIVDHFKDNKYLNGVKGLAYKCDGEPKINPSRELIPNLDDIPFPARHLLDVDKYVSHFENWFGGESEIRATNMISSRGCPYSCIYCDKSVFGSRWRGRSAKNIVDEMQFLKEKYNINAVMFSDDMFDLKKDRVFEICDEIDKRGLNMLWGINSRVNHANEETYRRMYKSGCRYVAFGIESGDQKMLDFMRKGIKLDQVTAAINAAKRSGLRVIGYFMVGMLGENRTTITNTIRFAKSLDLDSGGFSNVVPLPATPLYELAKKDGFIADDEFIVSNEFGGEVNLTKELTSRELKRIVEQAYWEFFWSRKSRNLSKPICAIISRAFPVFYTLSGGNMNFMIHINRIRERLRLPMP